MTLRIKKSLLNEQDGLWYYQQRLFNGIAFEIDQNYLVQGFEVKQGVFERPYLPICLGNMPLELQIDCSDFWLEGTDELGDSYQEYQEEIFTGIGYRFEEGICTHEAYYKDGEQLLGHEIGWDIQGEPIFYWFFYFQEQNHKQRFSFNYTPDKDVKLSFNFTSYKGEQAWQKFGLYFDPEDNIFLLESWGGGIDAYSSLVLPEYLQSKYLPSRDINTFIFSDSLSLHCNNDISVQKIIAWAKQGMFKECNRINLDNFYEFADLLFLTDKALFPQLKQLSFDLTIWDYADLLTKVPKVELALKQTILVENFLAYDTDFYVDITGSYAIFGEEGEVLVNTDKQFTLLRALLYEQEQKYDN